QGPESIAALDDGGFFVAWQDASGSGYGAFNIRGQRYDASGNTVGGELLINTQQTGYQYAPVVAGLSGGRVVVAWEDGASIGDGSGSSVKAQVYDALGAKLGTEFVVNTQTTGSQNYPSVAGSPAAASSSRGRT
ncbi:hypothetical protein ABTU92_30815, partial [Rhodoplanes sp. SY1]